MKISVIVCTCNRADGLKRTLYSLKCMLVPEGLSWEIIIVDNNSSDNTRTIVEDFKITSALNVVYAFEGKRGLANARNCGIQKAKGEIVAFTDDDCIVDMNWLLNVAKEYESDTSLGVIGGRVELYNQNDRPVTIRTFKERIIFSSPAHLFSLIPGCNMAIHRRVLDELAGFDPDFGAGTRVKSAEDSDFIYRAYKAGVSMVYCPDVLVFHNHGRNTEDQVRSLAKGYVIGRGAFYCKHVLRGDAYILRMAMSEVVSKMKGLGKNLILLRQTHKQRMMLWALLIGIFYRVSIEFRLFQTKLRP